MLEDEEWSAWSNCEIARQCNVVESYVRKMKEGHTSHSAKYESDERTFIHHKTGKPARMRTAKKKLKKPPFGLQTNCCRGIFTIIRLTR